MYLTIMSILSVVLGTIAYILFSGFVKRFHIPAFLTSVVMTGVLIGTSFATLAIGTTIAKNDAMTFTEYWNGYETDAILKEKTCHRDGSCVHTFSCDPYQVPVTKTRTVSDGNGGTRTETYVEMETRWHSCPYSTQESTYTVDSSIGTFTIASSLMTGDVWRAGHPIPGGKKTAPQAWLDAKARIDANTPGGVTKKNNYINYIQASDSTIFARYEGLVEDYLSNNALPKPVTDNGPYGVSKVYNVDGAISGEKLSGYSNDLSFLNSVFGSYLYGDLHIVFVPDSFAPDDYSNALAAYWGSQDYHGRNTSAKNTFVVVMGIDGSKVGWARGFTGMPVGNEALIQDINSLRGKDVDDNLIGAPRADLTNTENIVFTDGEVESLLWGENTFARVEMKGDEPDGGFSYLAKDVQIGCWSYFWIGLVNVILIGGICVGTAAFVTRSSDLFDND